MLKEFKEFAVRGNVMDMAIGIILGTAFGAIVSALVDHLLMPLLSLLVGGIDFQNWFIALDGSDYQTLAQAQEAGAATLNYGLVLNAVIHFLFIAFAIFLMVKAMNKLRRPAEEVVDTKSCPFCLSEIPLEATRCPHCTSELQAHEIVNG